MKSSLPLVEVIDDDNSDTEDSHESSRRMESEWGKRRYCELSVSEKDMTPYQLVVALCRRASIRQKVRRTKLVVAKAIGKNLPAAIVMEFLVLKPLKPLVLSHEHLRLWGVPPGQVFVTLRRMFWVYGRVSVPRSLRQLVLVDPKHFVEVKKEEGDKESLTSDCETGMASK